jgi:uncharacterized protein (UPF0335 family)
MSEPGHNANAQLKSIVERIEREEAAKAEIATGIKEIYQEAKSGGFDVKAIRRLVSIRKQDQAKREQAEAILATYMTAMGMAA